MRDLISTAILITTLFAGTIVAGKIYCSVRNATLTKAAHGLPSLSVLAGSLTKRPQNLNRILSCKKTATNRAWFNWRASLKYLFCVVVVLGLVDSASAGINIECSFTGEKITIKDFVGVTVSKDNDPRLLEVEIEKQGKKVIGKTEFIGFGAAYLKTEIDNAADILFMANGEKKALVIFVCNPPMDPENYPAALSVGELKRDRHSRIIGEHIEGTCRAKGFLSTAGFSCPK